MKSALSQLCGKIVKCVEFRVRGDSNFIEYVIHFTDSTGIRFYPNFSGDVEVEVISEVSNELA